MDQDPTDSNHSQKRAKKMRNTNSPVGWFSPRLAGTGCTCLSKQSVCRIESSGWMIPDDGFTTSRQGNLLEFREVLSASADGRRIDFEREAAATTGWC